MENATKLGAQLSVILNKYYPSDQTKKNGGTGGVDTGF